MRRKRYFVSGGKFLIGLGFALLIGSFLLAYSNNFTPLPVEFSIVILAGLLGFMGCIAMGSALIWFDTSWVTRRHRDMAAYTPDRDVIARVLISDVSKKEYFIYGAPDEIVHEVVDNDWPFNEKYRSKDWIVLDESSNDVSRKIFSEVEGTLIVVFD
ncbi:hypothetical protein EU528_12835 [Candidatus Thorarchaeota archaeon]|nr:MAG: hypothetical protein EU528_12835 [Candidatus Thorarchaeota archaeon]